MMKTKRLFLFISIAFFTIIHILPAQEIREGSNLQKFTTNDKKNGIPIEIVFEKGMKHYYPLMAIWVEDTTGRYIHPLYVAESIAKGTFRHAKYQKGKWKSGRKLIPSALPYWAHSQADVPEDSIIVPTPENPLPDAYTGATPTNNFVLKSTVEPDAGDVFNVLFEINQSWDWNEYWYNGKYPGNKEYMKSAQPALVYRVTVDVNEQKRKYKMKPIGHSHPYGANGELYEDISTLSTALKIADLIVVRLNEK